jgi:hypothetical protein
MIVRYLPPFALLALLAGCSEQEPPKKQPYGQIVVPSPVVDIPLISDLNVLERLPLPIDNPEVITFFGDVVRHPWVKRQPGLKELNREMVEDIEKFKSTYKMLAESARQEGKSFPSYEEFNDNVVRDYETLEREMLALPIEFPADHYQVLMLPKNVYKRVYVDDTALGIPFYIDVKVYELSKKDEVIEWHWKVLKGGKQAFENFKSGFIGRGDRDSDHYDPSHGLATRDRGVFLAFYPVGSKLFVVYSDAPWGDISKHLDLYRSLFK